MVSTLKRLAVVFFLFVLVSSVTPSATQVDLATQVKGVLAVVNGGTGVTSAQGNGTKVQISTGSTTTNDCVKYDANGNTVDAGAACGITSTHHGIAFTIGDPAGSTLSSGSTTTDYLTIPFACTIDAYNINIDAGTITVKFWKIATGTAIPTSSNSINTSGVGISSGTAIHSTSLGDFTTTTVTANDIMAMNISTVATAKFVNGVLSCTE